VWIQIEFRVIQDHRIDFDIVVVNRNDEECEGTRSSVVDHDLESGGADDGDLDLWVSRYAVRVACVGEVADGHG
jgi:hypothetical protein